MEVVEGGRTGPSLPPINPMDNDRVKREESEYSRRPESTSNSAPGNSYTPTFQRPLPPVSYQQSPSSHGPTGLSGLISPPESRRTSEEDKEQGQPARLSLPSIHEALNSREHAPTSAPLPPPFSQHQNPSPPEQTHRPFAPELMNPGPPYPASSTASAYSGSKLPTPSAAPSGPPDSLARPAFGGSNSRLPALHVRTEPSRPPLGYPPQPGPPTPGPPSHPAGPSSHGYVHPPSHYSYSQNGSGPAYQPSVYSASPRYAHAHAWRSDEANHVEESKRNGKFPGPMYGESVKRHLDHFDLEASLNEIAEGGGRLLNFTRHYGARAAAQHPRSDPLPDSIPSMAEVEDLVLQSTQIQDSLRRIQQLIHTQQAAALAEKALDDRHRQLSGQDDAHGGGGGAAGYADESRGAGGFAGPDPKKRRGRAAPPGRCHSCNRAETPEWRRGPDGARTLCNACGLHYAKLTRKMGTNNKAAALGNSNLRPKELGPGGGGSPVP